MPLAMRALAVLCIAIALFLLYAVVNALLSAGGARPGVAVGYVAGALILGAAAAKLWQLGGRRPTQPAA